IDIGGMDVPPDNLVISTEKQESVEKRQEPTVIPKETTEKVSTQSRKKLQGPAILKEEDEPGIGTVSILKGIINATSIKGQQRTLVLKSHIFVNDKIITGKKSKLAISFKDGTTLSLGEKSAIVMDKYVYDPDKRDKCGITVRFMKGVCRVITGAIAQLNPKRFEVRTRMATVGIRGCDLAFRSSPNRDDIYVISLSGEKTVIVATTSDGSQTMNILTGQSIKIDHTKEKIIDITKPQTTISIVSGQGSTTGDMSLEDIRNINAGTSLLAPSKAKLQPSPDGGLFILKTETSQ
ncbi:MAG: FecR domain-containing protein, partial [Kiritimatiellae bacterium]|nr:FecR domain-containing protein [Kiritimatiellia bacterium]